MTTKTEYPHDEMNWADFVDTLLMERYEPELRRRATLLRDDTPARSAFQGTEPSIRDRDESPAKSR